MDDPRLNCVRDTGVIHQVDDSACGRRSSERRRYVIRIGSHQARASFLNASLRGEIGDLLLAVIGIDDRFRVRHEDERERNCRQQQQRENGEEQGDAAFLDLERSILWLSGCIVISSTKSH